VKQQWGPLLIVTVLLLVPLAWPQTGAGDASQSGAGDWGQQTASASPQSGSGDTSQSGAESGQQPASEGPQPVFTHPEDRPPLALLSEVTANSYLNLGLGLTTAWDSNAGTFAYRPYSAAWFIVSPSLEVRQTRPTLTWYVGAAGGFTTATNAGYYNTANPTARAGLLYQINAHWQLNVRDSYLYSYDPFQRYLTYSSAPTFNQPNPTIYVPLTTTESNYGNIDLTYQINGRDSITWSGAESFQRYLHSAYSAYDLYSYAGGSYYQHRISARLAVGGGYTFTALDFGHGTSRSGISLVQIFASYQLGPHMYVSGWAGPEYTATKNLVPILCLPSGCFIELFHNTAWDDAFGGSFGWQGQRNAINLTFYKAVSDGGILLGVVRLYQFNGNFLRQLSPRWSFNGSLQYGNNTGYSTAFNARHLNSFIANAGLVRQVTPRVTASLLYFRYYETQKNLIGAFAPKWIDNRIQFTLQYGWGHSLGR